MLAVTSCQTVNKKLLFLKMFYNIQFVLYITKKENYLKYLFERGIMFKEDCGPRPKKMKLKETVKIFKVSIHFSVKCLIRLGTRQTFIYN